MIASPDPGGHIVTPDFKDKMGCKILCAPRDQSHISRQIINSIIASVYYITNNKTESSHKCSGNIKKRSLVEAP